MSMRIVPRSGSPSVGWSRLEKHYSPTSAGADVMLLGTFNAIQHKVGTDPEDTALAVMTPAAEIVQKGALYQTRQLPGKLCPFSLQRITPFLDPMRYSARNDASLAQMRATVRGNEESDSRALFAATDRGAGH